MVYFTLLRPATCFGSIRDIFKVKYYLYKKVVYIQLAILLSIARSCVTLNTHVTRDLAIGNIVVDCEISHYVK